MRRQASLIVFDCCWRTLLIALGCGSVLPTLPALAQSEAPPTPRSYDQARRAAFDQNRLCLLLFAPREETPAWRQFATLAQQDAEIARRLDSYEVAWLTVESTYEVPGENGSSPTAAPLLAHPGLALLRGGPGLAVLDYTRPLSVDERLVSIVRWRDERPLGRAEWLALLDLPQGTLTQRTLTYAVQTHRERPQSAAGRWHPVLVEEAASHAWRQAALRRQGHHDWERRFHRINARLGAPFVAYEVCAESWPGQDLLDSAEECVHSWRQSPGHWSSVNRPQPLFGYDMQRGANGVWYGVGLFGRSADAP